MISQILYSLEAFRICVNLCNLWEFFCRMQSVGVFLSYAICGSFLSYAICGSFLSCAISGSFLSCAISGRNSLFRVAVYLAVYLIIYIVGVEIDEYT